MSPDAQPQSDERQSDQRPADQTQADQPPAAWAGTLTALVVDWGGVLTPPLDGAMSAWAQRENVDLGHYRDLLRAWVGSRRQAADALASQAVAPGRGVVLPAPAGAAETGAAEPGATGSGWTGTGETSTNEAPPAAEHEQTGEPVPDAPGPGGEPSWHVGDSPVHRLERGEIAVEDFDAALAAGLAERGSPVDPAGLTGRMLADFALLDDSMVGLVRRAREAGIRTALLSNSWGNAYPDELMDGLFDAVVISGEVGMRKPELRIYRYAADRLGVPPGECVMVDDLPHNVSAAAAAGMVGVLHRSYEETLGELEILFDRPLR